MNHNTYVLSIYSCLIADICELSGVPLGTSHDITYDWVLIEGPKLDKQLLMYLEHGAEEPQLPEWISPLWDQFKSQNDSDLLGYIRQLLLFCYKIEFEPTNEQLRAAQAAFEDTDASVGIWEEAFKASPHDPLLATARQIVGRCIYRVDWSAIYPQHGPGAVYPPRKPSCKGCFSTIYTTIDLHYPYCDYMCALPNYWAEHVCESQDKLEVSDTIECRLVAVPKDSRGPRLICVHPSEAIWIQQGCRKVLEAAIEDPRSPCSGNINFSDQRVNGALALSSSMSQEYCTLDLKEASDRIACGLVEYLFGTYAYSKLSCTRASHVRLLDDRVIELRKWAPMGNCLTFPVQSLLFYSVVRAGIRCRYGIDCTDIYVFGDDIIFPRKYYDGAINALARVGMVPNMNKTFRHGFFRESCGVDAYHGKDVTPHRMRRVDASSVSGAMSICALAKALCIDGYLRTSDRLYRIVSEYFSLFLTNNAEAQGIYRYEQCDLVTLLKYSTVRFNRRVQRWETKSLLVVDVKDDVGNGAWWHLQESLLKIHRKGESTAATRGLEYTVPHRSRTKRGWIPVANCDWARPSTSNDRLNIDQNWVTEEATRLWVRFSIFIRDLVVDSVFSVH